MESENKVAGSCWSKLIFFWCLLGLILPNAILSITEPLSWIQSLANIFLPLGLFWLALASQQCTGKAALWLFPFTFLAAFELVLLNLYGQSVIAVDMFLNVATTNAGEVNELLGNMLPAMLQVVVIYLIPLILAIIAVVKHWGVGKRYLHMQRILATIFTTIGVITFILSFFIGNREYAPQRDLFPANAVTNAVIAVDRYTDSKNYPLTSRNYRFCSHATHPDSIEEIYILVIGETSRGENWQLAGYDRNTNPQLSKQQNVIYFPKTLSESNTTHKSVPMLLSALDARTFNDSINYVKSIMAAFREAGFHTVFLSAQKPNGSYIDYFGSDAHKCEFLCELNDSTRSLPDRDALLLPALVEELDHRHNKELIVLHTYGSHYNYADRYDEKFRKFTPDSPIGAEKAHRPQLINAYDNTILKTDWLLSSVINCIDACDCACSLMYTSDHGEDIFDDERNLFLHASPIPSWHQIYVPLLVWTSKEYQDLNPERVRALYENRNKNVSSSRAFFHTAMQLAGIEASAQRDEESLASRNYREPQRLYLSDHNIAVRFDDGYLKPYEMEILRHRGLKF